MDLNPGITVQQKKAATSNEARDNMNTRLAAGSGLSDIEAIEVDWLPELMQYSDRFVDLTDPAVEGRWLKWKSDQATTPDGVLIGYGTDIGPEGVCYRSDLFAAAGLPTDREEVATFLGESWDDYFAAGKQFMAASATPWFDSGGAIFQGMINQVENAYEESDGTPIPLAENTVARETYDAVLTAAVDDGLSAGLAQWSEDWTNAFQNDGFATMLCPGIPHRRCPDGLVLHDHGQLRTRRHGGRPVHGVLRGGRQCRTEGKHRGGQLRGPVHRVRRIPDAVPRIQRVR